MPITEGTNSEEGFIHRRGERLAGDSSAWPTTAHCTESSLRLSGIGKLDQQVTIGTLPDDVLLKFFKFFVDGTYSHFSASEEWHTLVHVCRRWRNLAFLYPRHLNLQLICRPPKRSVREMLDIWPELPIYIHDFDCPTKDAGDNVAAGLRLNHRVSGIQLEETSFHAWEIFWPLMQRPFHALTHLCVQLHCIVEDVIPSSFLGGSAPSLRVLVLSDFPFPALPELLLSATNLVHLQHEYIPRSGYISPQSMVTGLSALTRLESLSLTFRAVPDGAVRILPPHTLTLLPALNYLYFRGFPDYMEDLVAQIDTPLLESVTITLFHQEVLETPELSKFVRRADKLSLVDRAHVTIMRDRTSVVISQEFLIREVDPKTFLLIFNCDKWQAELSSLMELYAPCFPTPSPFECLQITVSGLWQDVIGDPDPPWLELFRLFSTVKHLRLCKPVAHYVAHALGGISAERVMEVLPALEIISMPELGTYGPVKEAISEFVDARQLSGHPVCIHWEGETHGGE